MEGYQAAKVRWSIQISPTGQFLGLVHHHPAKDVMIPAVRATSNPLSCTAGDNFIYSVGATDVGRGVEYAQDRHDAFLDVLSKLAHPAAKAIHTFLSDPNRPLFLPMGSDLTPEQALRVLEADPVESKGKINFPSLVDRKQLTPDPKVLGAYACIVAGARHTHPGEASSVITCAASPKDRVLFEVVGHPEWWMDPQVQKFHRARIRIKNAAGDITGQCSLCLQEGSLARLFVSPVSTGNLISFNAPAWQRFGRKKGLNAPTCIDCAANFSRGMEDLVGNEGTCRSRKDMTLLWWPTDPKDPDPWPLLDIILSTMKDEDDQPTVSEEEREAALKALSDGHFAVLGKLEGRASLLRYARIEGREAAANLRRWREEVRSTPFQKVARFLTHEGKKTKGNVSLVNQFEFLVCLWVLAGEEPFPREIRHIERLLRQDPSQLDSYVNHIRQKCLAYLRAQENPMLFRTPTEEFAYWLGCAFARANSLQIRRSKPQRPIGITSLDAASRDPVLAYKLALQHGTYRRKSGVAEDGLVREFSNNAFNALNDVVSPTRFNRQEQMVFLLAYQAQSQRELEAAKAAKADKAAKATETAETATPNK